MITVRLYSKSSGKPIKGKKVFVDFDGLGRGHSTAWTDDGGEAHFDVSPGTGRVIVDGQNAYQGELAGRILVYV